MPSPTKNIKDTNQNQVSPGKEQVINGGKIERGQGEGQEVVVQGQDNNTERSDLDMNEQVPDSEKDEFTELEKSMHSMLIDDEVKIC